MGDSVAMVALLMPPDRVAAVWCHSVHPQPMAAVVRGEVPCVIVRNVLNRTELTAALRRMAERQLLVNGRQGRAARGREWHATRQSDDIGVSIANYPKLWQREAPLVNALFDTLFEGLEADPIARLHGVLNTLAAGSGKRLVVPANMSVGLPGTPAIFRSHHNLGASTLFQPHFDGFNQSIFTMKEQPGQAGGVGVEHAARHPKYTTHSTMSAVLVLQGSDNAPYPTQSSPGSMLYNASVEELLRRPAGASRETSSPQPQPHVFAGGYGIGCGFNVSIYRFFEEQRVARYAPDLGSGDLYLFSASRVHETFNVFGRQDRITVATFLSWHEDDSEVLVWQ